MKYLTVIAILMFVACQSTESPAPDSSIIPQTTPAASPAIQSPLTTPAPTATVDVKDPNTSTCELVAQKNAPKQAPKVIKHTVSKTGCVVTQDDKVIYQAKHDPKFCESKYQKHLKHMAKIGYACK